MATSRSLVLDTEDQTGKKAQKSFTSVNPDATINEMLEFAQLINGLSANILKNSSYVEKTPLVAKSSRNITFVKEDEHSVGTISEDGKTWTMTIAELGTSTSIDDATAYVSIYSNSQRIMINTPLFANCMANYQIRQSGMLASNPSYAVCLGGASELAFLMTNDNPSASFVTGCTEWTLDIVFSADATYEESVLHVKIVPNS